MSTINEKAVIQAGRDAFRAGRDVRSNPYLITTHRHDCFNQGWHEAAQTARIAAKRFAHIPHCCN